MMHSRLIIVLCCTLLLLSAGCGPKGAPGLSNKAPVLPRFEDRDPNGVLNLALLGEPSNLNPILSTDSSSSAVHDLVYEGLIYVDRDLNFKPLLAEKWIAGPGGKKITFYLKPNVFWQDGKPFTADDVVFTFQKILDTRTNTVRRSNYVINGKPIKIIKVNELQVEFLMPEPYAPLLAYLSMQIIPKHIFGKSDINISKYNREPIGTGPFIFKEWRSGSHIIMERNERYHRRPAYLRTIIYRIIPNVNTQLVAFRKGEIDMTEIPAKDYPRFLRFKNLNLYIHDQLQYIYLGYNLTNPHFEQKKVRQALAYAVDKPKLVKALFKDLAEPAYAPVAPASWAYTDNIERFPYDPKKATKLFKEAGYILNKDGVLEKNGRPFRFTILVNQGNRDRERAAVIIKEYLRRVGVLADIQVLEWSTLLKKTNALQDPKDFDAVLIGWSLGIDPDGYSLWHSSEYHRGFNYIKYHNPEVDALLIAGRRELDQNRRKKIYQKIWQNIASDQPYLFLWYPQAISAISCRVGGYDPHPGPLGLIDDVTNLFVTH